MCFADLEIWSDSLLVTRQSENIFETKDPDLRAYLEKVQHLRAQFSKCDLRHIPREQNTDADGLAKLASIAEGIPGELMLHVRNYRSTDRTEIMAIDSTEQDETWMTPIARYIQEGVLPVEPRDARTVRRRATSFFFENGQLYKRSFGRPALRCITPEQGLEIIKEIHEGLCGNHQGERTVRHKVLRLGYFWPTIQEQARKFVKTCIKCQHHGPRIGNPPAEMKSITSPIPFAKWGLDIVGPFPEASPGRYKYLYVAIDYFTKWIEAMPTVTITARKTEEFVWKNLICRYGLPRVIITDNGTQFNCNQFRAFCQEWKIDLRFASVAHPQANGQVENANGQIVKALKKKLDAKKGKWAEILPQVLWANRTTEKGPTGETPYRLVYGLEAVVPVEIMIPSTRIQCYNEEENEETIRDELDLLEERRTIADLRNQNDKLKIQRYFNKKVRNRSFARGDLVLKFIKQPTKLQEQWEGPYIIKEQTAQASYHLQDMEGRELPHSWHAESLKKFYT